MISSNSISTPAGAGAAGRSIRRPDVVLDATSTAIGLAAPPGRVAPTPANTAAYVRFACGSLLGGTGKSPAPLSSLRGTVDDLPASILTAKRAKMVLAAFVLAAPLAPSDPPLENIAADKEFDE